jgi:hypothetical protein
MNKRNFLNILLLFFSITIMAQSSKEEMKKRLDSLQQISQKHHTNAIVVKTNPFAMLWGSVPFTSEFRLTGEYTLGYNQSAGVSIAYLAHSPMLNPILQADTTTTPGLTIPHITASGYRVQFFYRYYPFKKKGEAVSFVDKAPYGFFIGPHISTAAAVFRARSFTLSDFNVRANQFNVNLLCGSNIPLSNKVVFEVFTGFGHKQNSVKETTNGRTSNAFDNKGYYFSNFKFSLGFNVGYVF